MFGNIQLHKKHGLAPTIPICFICGEEKNEIALLGSAWKGDKEPPMTMVMDKTPCDKCQDYMQKGIILISVKDPERRNKCYSCKHIWNSPVVLAKQGEMMGITGEKVTRCPKCGKTASESSLVIEQDRENPYRTGGWCVVSERAIKEIFGVSSAILRSRVGFLEDQAWDKIGLPREKVNP